MPLIKDGAWAEDPWTTAAAAEEIPAAGPVVVALELWRERRAELLRRNGGLGVRLKSDEGPEEIAEDLGRLDLVALEFPKFTDGRAFSAARLLRERYGFAGEVRAVGDVLSDQAGFLARCGFDAVEVPEGASLAAWRRAAAAIGVYYQPATDGRPHVAVLRHWRSAAE